MTNASEDAYTSEVEYCVIRPVGFGDLRPLDDIQTDMSGSLLLCLAFGRTPQHTSDLYDTSEHSPVRLPHPGDR